MKICNQKVKNLIFSYDLKKRVIPSLNLEVLEIVYGLLI